MRVFAGFLIVLACVFIALGRRHFRRARRQLAGIPADAPRRRPIASRLWGWLFTAFGFLLMLAGVILW